jgi:TetR/AcrR family transcriptional regulator, repressor for neighboring sulfatase
MDHAGLTDDEYDLRLLAALLIVYGWSVFGTQLLTAFGYPNDQHGAVHSRLAELLDGLVS